MSLQDKLTELKKEFSQKIPQEVAEIIGKNTQELIARSQSAETPKTGDRFPEFQLGDSQGNQHSREALAAGKPLAVSFFRGFW